MTPKGVVLRDYPSGSIEQVEHRISGLSVLTIARLGQIPHCVGAPELA